MAPSGTVLHLLRNEHANSAQLAFLGVAASEAAGRQKKPTLRSGLGIFRQLLDIRRSDLAALPSTETEVKSIAKLVGTGGKLLVRDQATDG
jgi:hypothetical protein